MSNVNTNPQSVVESLNHASLEIDRARAILDALSSLAEGTDEMRDGSLYTLLSTADDILERAHAHIQASFPSKEGHS